MTVSKAGGRKIRVRGAPQANIRISLCTCEKVAENGALRGGGACFWHPFYDTQTRTSSRFNLFLCSNASSAQRASPIEPFFDIYSHPFHLRPFIEGPILALRASSMNRLLSIYSAHYGSRYIEDYIPSFKSIEDKRGSVLSPNPTRRYAYQVSAGPSPPQFPCRTITEPDKKTCQTQNVMLPDRNPNWHCVNYGITFRSKFIHDFLCLEELEINSYTNN